MTFRLKRTSFTLIELLVVVAIIALLIAILLPALSTARELAKGAICVSHLSQLTMAMSLYAHDYNGLWPGRSGLGRRDWENTLCAWIPIAPAQESLFDVSKGSLFPYVKHVDMYHCPTDKQPANGQLSYSINQRVYLVGVAGDYDGVRVDYATPDRFTRQPSDLIVFVDEGSPNDGNFTPISSPYGAYKGDAPRWYHSRRAGFGFADGHAEQRRDDDLTIVGRQPGPAQLLMPVWLPTD